MIVIVGVSHQTAPIEVREALAFPAAALADSLRRVREDLGLPEAMILSTCNRVEIYGRRTGEGTAEALAAFLAESHGKTVQDLGGHLYRIEGEAAVRHAFRVAASLDSLVIGEPQILGQVKDAYQIAEEAKALGGALNALRNRSLAAAKRARTETGIGHNAVSVSYVAVELARKIFGELKDRRVLLVGAGKMTELAAKHLVRGGAHATVLGGRTFARAEELAAALGGRAAPFESLRSELALADIVISGTGAPGIVIRKEDLEAARSAKTRPLFIIDIAVPRDVEASVADSRGVFLYDLDDLKSVADANIRERRKEAAAAEAIVEQEVKEFLAWQKSLDVVPILVELRRRGDEIRKDEIAKARKRLGALTPEQEAAVDAVTSSIVNKLLHPPTAALKEIAQNGRGVDQVALIRKLLGL